MKTLADRFLPRVKKLKNGCWEWQGSKVNGYGRMGADCKTEYAHRVSWLIYKGHIPPKLYVCHKCDNPSCVNPKHLFLGTAKDNMMDASRKGRVKIPKASHASDETHQVSKFTNDQVRYIRSCKLSGVELAIKFKVHPVTICLIRTRKTYRDVK